MSPTSAVPAHTPACRPCSVVLPAAVAGGRSTLATPNPPAARLDPAPVPSVPAMPDSAADRRPCLRAGNCAGGGQSPGCRRRSPPHARRPSLARRDARTRWAPSNRWCDSAPATSNLPELPACRRLRTHSPAAARRLPGPAQSVLRSSPAGRVASALAAPGTRPATAGSTLPNWPPSESAPESSAVRNPPSPPPCLCRCPSPVVRTSRQTDGGFVTRKTPASSAGYRRPESAPPPGECCRTESSWERRRSRGSPERGLPETLRSAPPERTSLGGAARRHARSPSRSCRRRKTRAPPAGDLRSAARYAAVWLVGSCLLPESRRSRRPTVPAWAAWLALSAGSPAESNNPTSCVPSRGPVQTPALPNVDFCPRLKPRAVYDHRSPPGTSLRCSTKHLLTATTS